MKTKIFRYIKRFLNGGYIEESYKPLFSFYYSTEEENKDLENIKKLEGLKEPYKPLKIKSIKEYREYYNV